MSILSDCCCGSPAPVNVVGAPGVAGAAGSPGARVLLGSANVNFNSTAAQPVSINALNYIIKDIVVAESNNTALSGGIGGVYETALAGTALGTFNFNAGFPIGYWTSMTLQSAALSGQLLLTGPVVYFILSQVAIANPANAWVYVYGYLLA